MSMRMRSLAMSSADGIVATIEGSFLKGQSLPFEAPYPDWSAMRATGNPTTVLIAIANAVPGVPVTFRLDHISVLTF